MGNLANNYIPPQDLAAIRRGLNARDKQIMDILVLTGYRLDDVLHLRKWQISKKTIRLTERKTGNIRTVDNPCVKPCGHPFEYVFGGRGRQGEQKKLHRSTFWRHFEKAVEAAGLSNKGYTVHSLRKVYAVNLYMQTRDIKAVQKDLGHKNIATTCLYIIAAL